MRMGILAGSAILAASFFVPDTAEAHGRLPEVTRISFGADGTLLARASFGLLVSRDAGASFDLVCAAAIGFGINEDPVYAASSDGALVATTAQGLAVSHDGACSWADADLTSSTAFVDVTADGSLALSSEYASSDGTSSRYESRLWRAGRAIGAPVDPSVVPSSFAVSIGGSRIDVAAHRFAGGRPSALVLSSGDEGATWAAEIAIALEPDEDALLAIASDDARVILRTRSAKGSSRVLVLDRESSAVRTVYRAPYGLTAVALSPDRSEIWVAGKTTGIEHAKTDDFAFERIASLDAKCLAVDARGVWACADDWQSGFTIGLSTDGGRTFAPKLRMCGIRGNLVCAGGCAGEWERERHELGCDEATATTTSSATNEPVAPRAVTEASDDGSASCAVDARSPRESSPFVAFLLALVARVRRVQSKHGRIELRDDRAPRPHVE